MLHFTFLDNAIGYDCVRCGARCCKGLGFALAGEELVALVGRAPRLAPFLQLQRTGVHAIDLEDGCWMLRGDGRCGIEVDFGKAEKPSTCRLFPVNRLLRFGDQLVVDLQFGLCPLRDAREVPAEQPGATVIRHDEVARELAEAGRGAIAQDGRLPAGAPDDLFSREAAVREATAGLRDAADPAAVLGGAAGADAAALRELAGRWRRYFDVPADEAAALDGAVARPLALVLPSLRLLAMGQAGAPPYPKLMRGLAARLQALAFLAALSQRAGRPASLRAFFELWHMLPLLREALARWEQPLTLADANLADDAPAELRTAYAQVQARAGAAAIGEVLEATPLAPALRPLLLRLVSDRMR